MQANEAQGGNHAETGAALFSRWLQLRIRDRLENERPRFEQRPVAFFGLEPGNDTDERRAPYARLHLTRYRRFLRTHDGGDQDEPDG